MDKSWEKEALKRKGLKGEFAYLEGVRDYMKCILKIIDIPLLTFKVRNIKFKDNKKLKKK